MSVSTLRPGVEQSHAACRLGILPCDVRTLRIVAHRARVAQVVQCGLTTHRPRHNVVDFERFGTQLLLQLAVFAAELRSATRWRRCRGMYADGAIVTMPIINAPHRR